MCSQTLFSTAVLNTMANFVSTGTSFSAHDITKELRNQVNANNLRLTDLDEEMVGGVTTQRIDHDKVRTQVREVYESNVLPLDRDFGRGFMLYVPRSASPAISNPTPSLSVPTPQITSPTFRQSPNFPVQRYLSNKFRKSQAPTLKQIQSAIRRKGSWTVRELKDVCESLGYSVVLTNPYYKSTVQTTNTVSQAITQIKQAGGLLLA